jgi:hypothetical protein
MDGTPHSQPRESPREQEWQKCGKPGAERNPKTLTALAVQLVDLLKMGANANLEVRQNVEEQFKSRRSDIGHHGPDARASDMEITCIRATVRTTILLVWMREASIWKLLAADVRPSRRQGNTVRTRLSNRKDFQQNFQNFGCIVVCPDGL